MNEKTTNNPDSFDEPVAAPQLPIWLHRLVVAGLLLNGIAQAELTRWWAVAMLVVAAVYVACLRHALVRAERERHRAERLLDDEVLWWPTDTAPRVPPQGSAPSAERREG